MPVVVVGKAIVDRLSLVLRQVQKVVDLVVRPCLSEIHQRNESHCAATQVGRELEKCQAKPGGICPKIVEYPVCLVFAAGAQAVVALVCEILYVSWKEREPIVRADIAADSGQSCLHHAGIIGFDIQEASIPFDIELVLVPDSGIHGRLHFRLGDVLESDVFVVLAADILDPLER